MIAIPHFVQHCQVFQARLVESVSAEESTSPGAQRGSVHLLSWAPSPCEAQHKGLVFSFRSVLMGRITISIQCYNENT